MSESKTALRQSLLAARSALRDSVRRAHDERIQGHLLALLAGKPSLNGAFYQAFRGEPDLGPALTALHAADHGIHLPVLRGQHLVFHQWQPDSTMTVNRFGIAEPLDGKACSVDALDFVFMPLVGFDARGARLGMGGGYYDRTFADRSTPDGSGPRLVGIAYQLQRVEALPIESWDVPLDAVLTEQGLVTFD